MCGMAVETIVASMATMDIEAMMDATTSERCENGEMGATDGWLLARGQQGAVMADLRRCTVWDRLLRCNNLPSR